MSNTKTQSGSKAFQRRIDEYTKSISDLGVKDDLRYMGSVREGLQTLIRINQEVANTPLRQEIDARLCDLYRYIGGQQERMR